MRQVICKRATSKNPRSEKLATRTRAAKNRVWRKSCVMLSTAAETPKKSGDTQTYLEMCASVLAIDLHHFFTCPATRWCAHARRAGAIFLKLFFRFLGPTPATQSPDQKRLGRMSYNRPPNATQHQTVSNYVQLWICFRPV